MASLASTCARTARIAARQVRSQSRGVHQSRVLLAAHNFTMPALSPTMTEGNIASWKVKEGDEFVAGDVLLEVETDKAQMDVEAQDDGVMAKIMTEGGAKGVKVGTRIAVIADAGDDISSLEIPPEESATTSEAPKETKQSETASESSSTAPEPAPEKSTSPSSKPKGAGQQQKYPLYPSVQVLLHQHHLNAEDIPPTGPNGRLLKGDVLAHLDQIAASYPKELQSRFTKLSHLDLSNIKPAAPKEVASKEKAVKAAEPTPELPVELAVPISLAAVLEVQKRMQDSLGITLPLSTFLSRAIALANEDLPFKSASPTADELFNSVLGLDNVPKFRHGSFAPDIIGLPDPSIRMAAPRRTKKADLFDELVAPKKAPKLTIPAAVGAIGAENVFSLSVGKGEEKRAKIFLERVKTVLEAEPGRLVL